MATFQFTTSCSFGLESVLARELTQLGLDEIKSNNGSVGFTGDFSALIRANLWCRTADRIWWEVAKFSATTFEELFQGTRKLPWASMMPKDACFPVSGQSHASQLTSVPACQSIVKKAIVEAMSASYGVSWFGEDGPTFPIRVQLSHDTASISLDTSGTGLHKRGYRLSHHEAPIRETLAAGMMLLSYWDSERLLVDPFCGSGTILLEAASIGLDRAPGWNRSFAAESWPCIQPHLWEIAREEVQDRYQPQRKLQILGYDSDPTSISLAYENFERAQLPAGSVSFACKELKDFAIRQEFGVMVTNPPYGERLSEKVAVEKLYSLFGQIMGPRLSTWSVYVIANHPEFARYFGQRETKKRKLYNGLIQCNLYQYLGPRPPRAGEPAPRPAQSRERAPQPVESPGPARREGSSFPSNANRETPARETSARPKGERRPSSFPKRAPASNQQSENNPNPPGRPRRRSD